MRKVGGSYINDFRKYPELKTAKDKFVVTPNNVTIDAYATFDVAAEPVVIFVPTIAEPRWLQIGDSFDEIIRNVGGTKGPQPGVYVVTGPDYSGDVPGEKHGRNWVKAAGQRLAEQRDIRFDALVLLREQLAGAAEPGLDLVQNQHHVVRSAELAHCCKVI